MEEREEQTIWIYDVSALPRSEVIVTSEFRAQFAKNFVKLTKQNVINVNLMKIIDDEEVN